MVGGSFFSILKDTAKEWSEDKASRHAAALSYYTIFSIAPMLIIAIAVVGLVFGQDAARERIMGEIGGMVGQGGAEAIQAMVEGASKPKEGIIATVLGVVALLFGASGVFGQLQDSMNSIWEVRPKPGKGVLGFLKARFTSFSMVLVIAFLLLVSLVLSAGLSALGTYVGGFMGDAAVLLRVVDLAVSLGAVTVLFAAMYKVLPDAKVKWGDVWTGAFVTALLFTVGRFLIGLYLGKSAVGSAYGAAGSLVIILLWIYYSSQILFFGAEFTQVYASRKGSKVVPDDDAEAVRKPEPVPGQPALEPQSTKERGAAKGRGKDGGRRDDEPLGGSGKGARPDREERGREGWTPVETPERERKTAPREDHAHARKEASGREPSADPEPAPAGHVRHPGASRAAGVAWKSRGMGAAAMALALAYVSGGAALRGLARALKGPRRA